MPSMRSSDSQASSSASCALDFDHGATGVPRRQLPDMVILDRLEPGIKSAVARTELTRRELNTLGLLYETLIARHEPGPGDDPRVMQTSASDVSLMLHALVVINKMEPD